MSKILLPTKLNRYHGVILTALVLACLVVVVCFSLLIKVNQSMRVTDGNSETNPQAVVLEQAMDLLLNKTTAGDLTTR